MKLPLVLSILGFVLQCGILIMLTFNWYYTHTRFKKIERRLRDLENPYTPEQVNALRFRARVYAREIIEDRDAGEVSEKQLRRLREQLNQRDDEIS